MYTPLSREFLLQRKSCCKNFCLQCPWNYKKKNMKELKTVMRDDVGVKGLKDLCLHIDEKIGGKITIIEVGSYMGESSVIFAEEFPFGKIICIDPWKGGYDENDSASNADYKDVEEQFDLRTKEYDNIYKVKDSSLDYYKPCDVVYIDGVHTYEGVKADLLHWLPQCTRVICGHDYCEDEELLKIHSHIKGVKLAVDEVVGKPDVVFCDNSWIKWIKK